MRQLFREKTVPLRPQEKGQVLVLGLIFFATCAVFALSLLSFLETVQEVSLAEAAKRAQVLEHASKIANILNTISLNNKHILSALGLATNAWEEGAKYSYALSLSHPYWKSTTLSENHETHQKIEKVFEAFDARSGRGLILAYSLALENRALKAKLAILNKAIASYLTEIPSSETFCLAATLARGDARIGENITTALSKLLPGILWPFFSLKECKLYADTDEIIDFRASSPSEVYSLGLMVPVGKKNLLAFIKKLLLEDFIPESVQAIEKQKSSKIITLSLLNLLQGRSGQGIDVENPIKGSYLVGISNSNLKFQAQCQRGNKAQAFPGTLLTVADWAHLEECSLEFEQALRAFLEPKWSAILVGRKP